MDGLGGHRVDGAGSNLTRERIDRSEYGHHHGQQVHGIEPRHQHCIPGSDANGQGYIARSEILHLKVQPGAEEGQEREAGGKRHPQHPLAGGLAERDAGHDPHAHQRPPSSPTIWRNSSSSERRWGVTSYTSIRCPTRYRTISGTTAVLATPSVTRSPSTWDDEVHWASPLAACVERLPTRSETVVAPSRAPCSSRVSSTSPCLIKATRSQVISTSPKRCELRNTVVPRRRWSLMMSRTKRRHHQGPATPRHHRVPQLAPLGRSGDYLRPRGPPLGAR